MKFKLDTTDLTGDDNRELPSNFRINGEQIEQPGQFLRAEAIKMFGRKNLKTNLSFDVKRLHDSIAIAQAFVLTHYSTLPRGEKLLDITYTSTDSSETHKYFADCTLSSVEGHHVGSTSFFTYKLAAGLPVDKKP